ncbi:MAG: SEC-C domain-containing protein [Deltaproteobacteria bacterium]|nr:SEC-C domain-containing protein [Deltaproteobacteria bacterium]MBW1949337.1 SEC-C domain-containing protein [Deltaproteobacteria bacterium]MBW2008881.1 SEC-C domain-containing protein [Deltaproteobacteria bacterium]MBW2102947.1 SEC-C domain-containing protein [Deltaproteobacteria bacterium]MBW2348142.1 SEC-C domain-containing protein [Deltaproteobacteria bacterium]
MGILNRLLGARQPKEIPKLGRNDLCWCGSGKKYKRCHLDSDMRKRSRVLDSRCTTRS